MRTIEETICSYVIKNPGKVAEEIATALRITDREKFGRVLRKLRDSKHLRGKGATRAMKYTATAKALA